MKRPGLRRAAIALAGCLAAGFTNSAPAHAATVVGAAHLAPPPRPISWLAAGDSYSSGQGLTYESGTCARGQYLNVTQAGPWPVGAAHALVAAHKVTLAAGSPDLVACTGAKSSEFFSSQAKDPAQWAKADGRFDLVTFSFGGDDVNFTSTVMSCLGIDSAGLRALPGLLEAPDALAAYEKWVNGPIHCPSSASLRNLVASKLGAKHNDYVKFLTKVAAEAVTAGGNIVVLGYPEIVEDPKLWSSIDRAAGMCWGIRPSDAYELRGLAGDLNATIAGAISRFDAQPAAERNNVEATYVDVNTGNPRQGIPYSDPNLFEPNRGPRHNLCAAQEWLNGITFDSHLATGFYDRSFHPNQEGNDAMARLLEEVFPTLDWSHLATPLPLASHMLSQATAGLAHTIVPVGTGYEAAVWDQHGNITFWKYQAAKWAQVGASTYPMLGGPPTPGVNPLRNVTGALLAGMTDATFIATGYFTGDGSGKTIAFTNGPKGWGTVAPGPNNTLVPTGQRSTDNGTPGIKFDETFNGQMLQTTDQNPDFFVADGPLYGLVTDWKWNGEAFVDAHDNVFTAQKAADPQSLQATPLPLGTCPNTPPDGTYSGYYVANPTTRPLHGSATGTITIGFSQNLSGEGPGVGFCSFTAQADLPVTVQVATASGATEWVTAPAWLLVDPFMLYTPPTGGTGLPPTTTFLSDDFHYGQSPYYIPPSLGAVRLVTSSSDLQALATLRGGKLAALAILERPVH